MKIWMSLQNCKDHSLYLQITPLTDTPSEILDFGKYYLILKRSWSATNPPPLKNSDIAFQVGLSVDNETDSLLRI